MSHYKPYPAYKDSGVEWLGQVPAHWDVKAIRWLSTVQRGASPRPIDDERYFDDENGEYGWVRIEDVSASDGFLTQTKQHLSVLGSDLSVKLEPGSLFLSIAGSVGKPCINLVKACIHDGFVYFPMLSIDPMWLFKIFESRTPFVGLGKMGTQLNLNTETVGGIRVAIPPADEIVSILRSINCETARIDGLISRKTRFIELLREKRQALITHAVTKGLDPNAPMKDSGVAWLGDVPAHWRVLPLKWELLFLTSGSRGWADYYADDGALFIRIGNLTRDSTRLDLSDIQRVLVPRGAEGERTIVFSGDLLFSITAFLGSVAVVPSQMETAYVSQHVALARLLGRVLNPEWVGYVALSWVGKTHLESQGYGGTKVQLSLDDIANLIMIAPPMDEQLHIVDVLAQEMERIDTLIGTSERSIELLKERRSALITAAVTGQIDLRETV